MRRNGFQIMMRLAGLVKPLAGYMILAITMGLIGHLCAAFITVFGGFAVLNVLEVDTSMSLTAIFVALIICGHWMLNKIVDFMTRLWSDFNLYIG